MHFIDKAIIDQLYYLFKYTRQLSSKWCYFHFLTDLGIIVFQLGYECLIKGSIFRQSPQVGYM